MSNGKGRVMETIIAIAGEISPTLGKTIDGVNKQLGGISDKALVASAAITAIGTAAVGATKYLAGLGNDYKKAINDVAASTGLVGEELNGMKDTMKEVYGANFGENMADVADGVSAVYQNTKLMGDELTAVTKAAYALSDTFDYDIAESSRAAKAMMTNFGISGEEAMGLIAAGAQNGLDYSGELIDTVNEYSVQFAKLGFTADDMFNVFQQGADSGAWNLDKVGDAVKEFSIRAIDGSKTTIDAYEQLGLNADDMMQTFASGGDAANAAFKDVAKSLIAIEDPVKRDAIGVQLFGTMWEDLGVDAVAAMANATDAAYNAEDALGKINAVKYDDLDSAFEGIKRKAETALMPAGEKVADAFLAVVPKVEGMIDKVSPLIVSLADNVGPLLTTVIDLGEKGFGFLTENIDTLVPVVGGLVAAMGSYKAITVGVAAAQKAKKVWDVAQLVMTGKLTLANTALGTAMMAVNWPIVLVTAAIGGLVAGVIWLYKNWDTAKIKVMQFGEKVGEIWNGIELWIGGAITRIGEYFPMFGGYLSGWWSSISAAVGNVKAIFTGVIDFVSNVFAGNWKAAWGNVIDIFGNLFGAIANIAKAPINGVVGALNTVIGGINGAGFTIPDWVPVVGGKSFSINIPKIPMLAAGGFTNGVSIAGEAGTEAVISFNRAYRAENLSYWAEAGRMLGVDPNVFALSGNSGGSYTDLGGVTFAPNITVQGNAKKDDIIAAIREVYPEFMDLIDELLDEREEAVYA